VPGSSKCGTARKKVSVHLKVVPGDKHDQDRADTKHAFGKKFLGAKAGDVINGCTVERILGFGRDSAVPGSIVQLDCPSVIRLAFCMDRYEYPNQPGATPARLASWYEAQETCEAAGKRLCEEQDPGLRRARTPTLSDGLDAWHLDRRHGRIPIRMQYQPLLFQLSSEGPGCQWSMHGIRSSVEETSITARVLYGAEVDFAAASRSIGRDQEKVLRYGRSCLRRSELSIFVAFRIHEPMRIALWGL